ncbi:mannosyl-oligosaccharide 1,2-alpha-mannosidase [Ephemerocybe angulata]|uniref:alpha-1,2-Mannosidase n=1 Tax=Ephemerocybe angulata TaxID=980116 RepID=A0A8H6HSN2_9AGAR|nr:mannosyl-oligosaccharide 1,2-alpha-mannosidase [Tulosesus angulatus]
MLPVHSDGSPARSTFSRLTTLKSDSWLGRRPVLRWVALGSIVLVTFVFFVHPFSSTKATLVEKPAPAHNRPPKGSSTWDPRKEEVRQTFLYAWKAYMDKAFPNDEVLPLSGRNTNKFNGWAVTLVDSLDTMWLMGLKDEFKAAVNSIKRQEFLTSSSGYAPFFETIIRYLGGYLSAYALSGDKVLLSLADDLGERLLPAFNTEPIGWPAFSVRPGDGSINKGGSMLLAEMASCQVEYKYLSKATGRPEYYEKVENVMQHLYDADNYHGLLAERWYLNGKPTNNHYTAGAGVDSAYEYFLKQYLQSGDQKAKKQYLKSIDGIINKLLFLTPTRQLLFVTDITGSSESPANQMEHLSCYLPGVIALGAHSLDLPAAVKQKHEWAAEGLAYTCWVMYADQKSHLGPDNARMVNAGKWVDALKKDYTSSWSGQYLMRPETVESLYIMWKTTGDEIWRDRGYAIYQAIEKHTKAPYGYASVSNIDSDSPNKIDEMPSFFLAETLKYLYLLFDNDDPISLDKWVFNTEAHPLPIFSWSADERAALNITS